MKNKSKILFLDTYYKNTYLKFYRQMKNLVSKRKNKKSIYFFKFW